MVGFGTPVNGMEAAMIRREKVVAVCQELFPFLRVSS